jgi:hypothetical protein
MNTAKLKRSTQMAKLNPLLSLQNFFLAALKQYSENVICRSMLCTEYIEKVSALQKEQPVLWGELIVLFEHN